MGCEGGELRSHEYQRELTVGTHNTTIPQRVREIRVDSVLKFDRATKRESTDENHEEVPPLTKGHLLPPGLAARAIPALLPGQCPQSATASPQAASSQMYL